MLARLLPILQTGARQIVPPVIATVIAAVLIAGYNRAFSGHLMQPRMAAVQGKIGAPDEMPPMPLPTVKPGETAETVAVLEPVAPQRLFAKDDDREAAKDETALKIAAPASAAPQPVAAAAPVPPAVPVARSVARKSEPRAVEQRPVMVATAPVAPAVQAPPPVVQAAPMMPQPQPVIVQGPPSAAPYPQPVAQEPPPVIAAKPMVTVPDRQRPPYAQNAPVAQNGYPQNSPYEAQDVPPPPQGGPLERFVDTFKPSSIFARMRELGDKIEAAGNDILPNVRPQ